MHDSGLYEKKYFVCVQFTANAVSNFPINGQCSKRIVCKDGYQHIFKTTHISIPSNFPLFIHGICIFELLATVNKAGFCQPHYLSPTSQKYVGRFKRLTSYFYKFQINKTYIHGTVEKNKCI